MRALSRPLWPSSAFAGKAGDGGGGGGVSSAEDALLLVGESASVQEARASPGYAGRLLVARTRAGLPVGIKLDVNRPDRFESEAARARWDLSVTRNAMRLKEQLESGDIAPEIIKDSLDFNVHVPEDDRRSHAKDEVEIQNQLRLRWEQNFVIDFFIILQLFYNIVEYFALYCKTNKTSSNAIHLVRD